MTIGLGTIALNLKAGIGGFVRNMTTATKSVSGFAKAGNVASVSMDNLDTSMGHATKAVGGLASVIGIVKLGSFIRESTLLAGRVENLGTVVNNVGQIMGYNTSQIAAFEDRVKSMGITTRHARQSMALMAQSQLDLAYSAKLARVAQDAAVIAGINSSDAFNRLTVGIQRTNTWILRNLGILINANQLYQKHALITGRTVNTLASYEKQQLFLNEVLRKGALITGTYEAAMQDAYKQYTSLARYSEEASKAFGEQFIPAFEVYVKKLTELLKWWTETSDTFKQATAAAAVFALGLVTLGTAISAVTLASKYLWTALGTAIPVIGAIALTISGAAAAWQFFAAQSRNAAEAQKKHTRDLKAGIQTLAELQEAYASISSLGNVTDRTAAQQSKLDATMANVVLTLKDYSSELHIASTDTEAFLAIMRKATRGVSNSIERELQVQRNRLFDAAGTLYEKQEQLRESEAEDLKNRGKVTNVNLGGHPFSDYAPVFSRKLDASERTEELRKQVEILKKVYTDSTIAHDAYVEAVGRQEFLRLKDLVQGQETAFNLALKGLKRYQTARQKLWNDSNLVLFRELKEFRQQISPQALDVETITAFANQEADNKIKQLTEDFASKWSEDKRLTEEYKKAKKSLDASIVVTRANVSKVIEVKILESTQIIDALEASVLMFETSLTQNNRANARLKESTEAISLGLDKELLKSFQDLHLLRQEQKDANTQWVEEQKESAARVKAIQADLKLDLNAQERLKLENELKYTQETAEMKATLQITQAEAVALAEEKITVDILKKREKLLKEAIAEEKDLLGKRAEILGQIPQTYQALKDHFEDVKNGIKEVGTFLEKTSQDVSLANKDFFKLANSFDEFVRATKKADANQLEKLLVLWPEKAKKAFDDLNKSLDKTIISYDDLEYSQFKDRFEDQEDAAREYAELLEKGVDPKAAGRMIDDLMARREYGRQLELQQVEEQLAQLHLAGQQMDSMMVRIEQEKYLTQAAKDRTTELAAEEQHHKTLMTLQASELALMDEETAKLERQKLLLEGKLTTKEALLENAREIDKLSTAELVGRLPQGIDKKEQEPIKQSFVSRLFSSFNSSGGISGIGVGGLKDAFGKTDTGLTTLLNEVDLGFGDLRTKMLGMNNRLNTVEDDLSSGRSAFDNAFAGSGY